jgi:hypothetical protein
MRGARKKVMQVADAPEAENWLKAAVATDDEVFPTLALFNSHVI